MRTPAILKMHSQAHGILFDVPNVTENARRLIEAEGIAASAVIEACDFSGMEQIIDVGGGNGSLIRIPLETVGGDSLQRQNWHLNR